MDNKDIILKFSESIISHDIPLYTMKAILYLISKNEKTINIDTLCSMMYINKRKLTNELNKIKPINSILHIDKNDEGFFQLTILDNYKATLIEEKKNKKNKTTENVAKDKVDFEIQELFKYWCSVMGKTGRTRLDVKRRKVLNTALESMTFENCKKTIFGCSQSPWHMGHNPQNKEYNSIELIFRDQEKIDGFIADAEGLSLDERVENENKIKPIKIEDRIEDNDWISKRMSDFNRNKTTESILIESGKEKLQIENKKNENSSIDYNVKGLVYASLKAMNINVIEESDFEVANENEIEHAEFEIINDENIIEKEVSISNAENDEELPLYLQLAKNKNKNKK